jgi:hypothetical protein
MAAINTITTNNKANNTNGTGTKRNRPPTARANEAATTLTTASVLATNQPVAKSELAGGGEGEVGANDIRVRAEIIRRTLASVRQEVTVEQVLVGPTVTQYRLRLGSSTLPKNVASHADKLALELEVGKVHIHPVPGTGFMAVEVENERREVVRLEDLMVSEEFGRECAENDLKLPLALGKDQQGKPVVIGLEKLPHIIVAGTTGAGKSVWLNATLYSLISRLDPEDLRLVLIDPKMVELVAYNGLPHLIFPVAIQMLHSPVPVPVPAVQHKTASVPVPEAARPQKSSAHSNKQSQGASAEPELEPKPEPGQETETETETDALSALVWTVEEMERRYRMFSCYSRPGRIMRDIKSYNNFVTTRPEEAAQLNLKKLPYIVVVIDEIADLMSVAAEQIEPLIVRLAQKARSSGIHLILATQRPSVDVLTGLIKSNVPARIAFAVTSQTDSRVVLDRVGAEDLLGEGDMLFLKQGAPLRRVQGALISDEAINELVERKALPGVRAGVYDYAWMLSGSSNPTNATAQQPVKRVRNTVPTVTTLPVLPASEPKLELEPTPATPVVRALPAPPGDVGLTSPAPATGERHLDSLVVNTQAVHILPTSTAPVPPAISSDAASALVEKEKEKVSEVAVATKSGSGNGSGNGGDIAPNTTTSSSSSSSSSSSKPARPTPTNGSVVRKKATTASVSASEGEHKAGSSPREVELKNLVEQLRVELAKITGERDAALTKLSTTEQAYNLVGEAYRQISEEKEEWQKQTNATVGALQQTLVEKEQLITKLQGQLAQLKTNPPTQPPAVAAAAAAAAAQASKPQSQTTATAVTNVTGNVLDLLTALERNRHKVLSQKIAKMPGQDKRVLATLIDQYELNPGTYLTIAQLANLIGVSFDTIYRKPPLGLIRLEIVERKQAQGHYYYRLNFPTFVRDYFPSLAADKSSVADKAGLVRKFLGS